MNLSLVLSSINDFFNSTVGNSILQLVIALSIIALIPVLHNRSDAQLKRNALKVAWVILLGQVIFSLLRILNPTYWVTTLGLIAGRGLILVNLSFIISLAIPDQKKRTYLPWYSLGALILYVLAYFGISKKVAEVIWIIPILIVALIGLSLSRRLNTRSRGYLAAISIIHLIGAILQLVFMNPEQLPGILFLAVLVSYPLLSGIFTDDLHEAFDKHVTMPALPVTIATRLPLNLRGGWQQASQERSEQRTRIAEVISNGLRQAETAAVQRNLTISLDMPEYESNLIVTDSLLETFLTQLIKFSADSAKEGSTLNIQVRHSNLHSENHSAQVLISVAPQSESFSTAVAKLAGNSFLDTYVNDDSSKILIDTSAKHYQVPEA